VEERRQLFEVALSADEGIDERREVRRVQRAEWRKRTVAELIEPDGLREVLEPVQTKVAKLVLSTERVLRLVREDDLTAVGHAANAGGLVHVESDIALLRDLRLAGVETHPHRKGELLLCLSCRGDRRSGRREGDEEGISLRVDLDAAVASEGLAQHAPVLGEGVRVRLAELRQQPRRALDVREEEGDCAGRQVTHRAP
jgi:hypothetical protein